MPELVKVNAVRMLSGMGVGCGPEVETKRAAECGTGAEYGPEAGN